MKKFDVDTTILLCLLPYIVLDVISFIIALRVLRLVRFRGLVFYLAFEVHGVLCQVSRINWCKFQGGSKIDLEMFSCIFGLVVQI